MEIKPIAKPLPITVFVGSGVPLEGRVALGPAREPTFGPPRRPTAGFRRLGGRAKVRQKRRNGAMDPDRRKACCIVAALPRQPQVLDARARQPELGESGHNQPRPPVGLLGVAHPRRRPSHALLEEAEGVLQIETPHIRAPDEVQIRRRPLWLPCHHSHKTRGFRRLSPRGRRSTSTRTSVPTTMGGGPRLPRPSWFWTFGCSSAHARTRTDP